MKEENKLVITLKDGSRKEYAQPMSAYDIARDISDGLARVACMAEIDGKAVDLSHACYSCESVTQISCDVIS